MTNTEAQKVLADIAMGYVHTDKELEALVMAGEALDDDWISVEDKLPPITNEEERTSDMVLIAFGKVFQDVAWYDYRHKGWESAGRYFPNVSHWRPLPEGPEVEWC